MSGPRAIDRVAVAARHSPTLGPEDAGILSVGNGSVAVGLDRTGTHTLGTVPGGATATALAEWGWHTIPAEDPAARREDHERRYDSPRDPVPYMDLQGPSEAGAEEGPAGWFRANPHKVSLFGLLLVDRATGTPIAPERILPRRQRLDLTTGVVTSTFLVDGEECTVLTAADPEVDALAVEVSHPALALALRFGYGTQRWDASEDLDRPDRHTTTVQGPRIRRELDDLVHEITVHGATPRRTAPHRVVLDPDGPRAEVVLALRPLASPHLPVAVGPRAAAPAGDGSRTPASVRERSARFWREHWESTGTIDLSGTDDPRAHEVERRTVLSRQLQRVHAAGRLPPAETGLLQNSWRGRMHLEMHWWHAAHFPVWGDVPSLRRSLSFYTALLPTARETARRQGCRGARWPKQVGPDGLESPSDIGPFLLWQQPHPIHLAELCRRTDPRAGQDPELQEIVEQSALFLRDVLREDDGRLGLGPPIVGAQERHVGRRAELEDPAFELAYTAWALEIADEWRHRRGARDAGELEATARRVHAPLDAHGRLRTFRAGPAMERSDHPAHLLAHGLVPPRAAVPAAAAREALEDVLEGWDWSSTWGWDCPAAAMTATRLGFPDTAVDLLLRDTPKNRHDASGHCFQRDTLPVYLPANGGTAIAVALMAAGWDGGGPAPGLPGDWGARVEGITPLPGPR
ncbi:hypothetical protein NLU66_04725 [Brachybacterium sp. NBEC-018]|uniref:hypothetical protein n=1 Tax=Brachybacterium sp. NBEC-018 TaxID=2996004 RepID=UPI002174E57B|nr:hypothetical protein [Brachybacterium sp. NBEC-018]UVY84907.1 hypothetical protein NLU66_04725 [Brachybacterium sp. NBEC-018]